MKSASSTSSPIRHAALTARYRTEKTAYWCVAPSVILLAITTIAPFAAVVMFSFTDYELGATGFNWVGLGNFARMINDQGAQKAIRNTLLFAGMVVPTTIALAMLFAVLVNERVKTRRAYEILFFLPITATVPVMSLVWSFILHDRIGPVHALMMTLGMPQVSFLSDPRIVLTSLAFIAVWQHLCFAFIIFLAGLTTIPKELYEAAALDGADRGWERLRRITLPLLGPTSLVVALLTTLRTLQVFDLIIVLTQGGPDGRSEVILYRTYLEAFAYFRVGYGSALALIFVGIVGIISVIQFLSAGRRK
ncbi:carbohydrate ABC transporter permease [Rhizobium tubonense]|uniref:ABC transporter permease n=1 Tax=Rhizobium tubonense TaxID=484088 RepID=A0A2W4CPT0_9HYPH|nr:sugar ABC transporter permease [Rhizobium tubonense]PZM12958.1 ABC transporter permease [Rhizobium tubonense]